MTITTLGRLTIKVLGSEYHPGFQPRSGAKK